MKVLMITGDKKMRPGHLRFDLQARAVERLAVVYWGRGSVWPGLPGGLFDVVTVQDPFVRGLFAWSVARRLGAKLNVQVHTDLSAQPLLKHLLAQIVLHHADSVRVVSEKIKQQVENMGVKEKISVLPVFVDAEEFRSITQRPHTDKVILWLGRFEDEKDPIGGITVFTEVLERMPEAKLVLLGKGSLEDTLRAQARGLRVDFPGWQDPKPYLATSDVVLCTSRHESFGASIVEALAAGVPVVAPEVGMAREAGAIVVSREKMAATIVEVLRNGQRGSLRLRLPNKEEWAHLWRNSLV